MNVIRLFAALLAVLVLSGCMTTERDRAPVVEQVAAKPTYSFDPSIADDAGWLRPASLEQGPPETDELITEVIPKADRVVIEKGLRRLTLFRDGAPWKRYQVALGFNPVGPKKRAYDGRTPEGTYTINFKNENSKYFRSLKISYPGPDDLAWARKMQVDPGGDIFIHGMPNDDDQNVRALHPYKDWTWGCIAVTNAEILELWAHVDEGTPIELKP